MITLSVHWTCCTPVTHAQTWARLIQLQGCPQDVKSQDQDESETVNLQDRDETETFHFPKLSRPRRDATFNLQDGDETETFQKRLQTALSQFKNTNW